MKRPSEAAFGKALRDVDDSVPTYVYRLPDPKMPAGVSNPKPCDFMAFSWSEAGTIGPDGIPFRFVDVAWFEVKDITAVEMFNASAELRPSQVQGIRIAQRIGIPYWVAVYWRRHKSWTISDGIRIRQHLLETGDNSVSRDLLQTRFGVQAFPRDLTSTLKSLMAGEVR